MASRSKGRHSPDTRPSYHASTAFTSHSNTARDSSVGPHARLFVPTSNQALQRFPSASAVDKIGDHRSRDRLAIGSHSEDYGMTNKAVGRSRTPSFSNRNQRSSTDHKNGTGMSFLAASMPIGRSVSWGAIDQIGLAPATDLHYQRQQHQQQQQQQQPQQQQQCTHLDESEVYRQICRAKAEAKTVSTVNGCLYIDYKFIGQLPPGY